MTLQQEIMEVQEVNYVEANQIIRKMINRINSNNEAPEDVLFDYGISLHYVHELINFAEL
jgi:hypothetical protein